MKISFGKPGWTAVFLVIISLLILAAPSTAGLNTIPAGGTVFIGEENLDITASGAVPGSSLVWYGSGGSVTSSPAAQVTVGDPTAFYASPASFSGKTGPWFLLPGNSIAFYIKEPTLEIRVVDYSSDFVIGSGATWVPKGDTVGFRIDTNLWEMALRGGVTGAPVIVRLTGPGGIQFSSLGGYSLEDITIPSVPFETGPVWQTGLSQYPAGTYTVFARCDANDLSDNNPSRGKAISEDMTFLLQKDNPLITPTTPTQRPTTNLPSTLTPIPTDTAAVSPVTTIQTIPLTPQETITPRETTMLPTTIPGFDAILVIASFITAFSLAFMAGRRS